MSYFSGQSAAPMRHRSSSSVRNAGGVSSYSSRPRSLSYFGSNTSPYSSPYSSPTNPYSNSNYNSYTSNYKSPYFQNGYRRGSLSGGLASLTIPLNTLSGLNSITSNYKPSRDYTNKTEGHRSRRDSGRGGSFHGRERSASSSRASGMGSRSISLSSLNSEGYVSGTDRNSRSRLGSTTDIRNENGEIDYKKLYEQAIAENDRLKDKLRKTEEDLRETKQTLEKLNLVTSKNSLSELEKRERRAMERKLSEMEEELKQMETLREENEKLKGENGALIRVISKLSK